MHAIIVRVINDDAMMIGFLSMLSRFFECSTTYLTFRVSKNFFPVVF